MITLELERPPAPKPKEVARPDMEILALARVTGVCAGLTRDQAHRVLQAAYERFVVEPDRIRAREDERMRMMLGVAARAVPGRTS